MNQADVPYRQTEALLRGKGLDPTPLRTNVLHVLLRSETPLQACAILQRVRDTRPINKATLYRILDLFVERGLALRHSSGERSFRYCAIVPNTLHDQRMHCHFHCTRCGAMQCITHNVLPLDCETLVNHLPQHVEHVEIRLDGLCEACEKKLSHSPQQ